VFSLRGLQYATFFTLLVVVTGAAAFESAQSQYTYFDSIYWAVGTMTTVGSGNVVPTTNAAKLLAMALMVVGVGYFAVITGSIAQRFVAYGEDERVEEATADSAGEDLHAQVERIALRAPGAERPHREALRSLITAERSPRVGESRPRTAGLRARRRCMEHGCAHEIGPRSPRAAACAARRRGVFGGPGKTAPSHGAPPRRQRRRATRESRSRHCHQGPGAEPAIAASSSGKGGPRSRLRHARPILKRDLTHKTYAPGDGCAVQSGHLNDPYTASPITFVRGGGSEVDIDHVVALSDAWQKGAQQWSAGKRIALANDPLNLLSVDAHSNRAKGDGDAATWLPPNAASLTTSRARSRSSASTTPGSPAPSTTRSPVCSPAAPTRLCRAPAPCVSRMPRRRRRPREQGQQLRQRPHFANCDAVRAPASRR
jgi:hypothetical protein